MKDFNELTKENKHQFKGKVPSMSKFKVTMITLE